MSALPARGILVTYGGHNSRECGHEAPPTKLRTNVRLELRTAAGPGTVKLMMSARLAWLLEEGMDLPVLVDPTSGLPVGLDEEALAHELEDRQFHAEASYREQTRLLYDLPKREELAHLKELPGEVRGIVRGLRDAWRRR